MLKGDNAMGYQLYDDQRGLRLLKLVDQRPDVGGQAIWVLLSDGTASARSDIFVSDGTASARSDIFVFDPIVRHLSGNTLACAWEEGVKANLLPERYPAELTRALERSFHNEEYEDYNLGQELDDAGRW